MLGASELNVSASGVAEGVFTLCMFPVTVAVVQQSVRKVGSCSLDVRVRCCRVQWRRKWRRDRLKVGGGCVELIGARQPGPIAEAATCGVKEALQRRTRRTDCGRPCNSLGAMGYYHPRSRSGFVSVVWAVGHRYGD